MKPSVIALTLFCKTSTYRRSNGPCSQRRTTDDGQATSCCPRLRWSSDLKSHLRLIHGSMILDNIRTRFLGGNLYAGATYTRVYTVFYTNCIGYQYARELLSRRPCWYTNVGMVWLRHTCRHTASQRHHTAVGVTCALLSPVNSLFHVQGQISETPVLSFTGQSCGTVFQPISVC